MYKRQILSFDPSKVKLEDCSGNEDPFLACTAFNEGIICEMHLLGNNKTQNRLMNTPKLTEKPFVIF